MTTKSDGKWSVPAAAGRELVDAIATAVADAGDLTEADWLLYIENPRNGAGSAWHEAAYDVIKTAASAYAGDDERRIKGEASSRWRKFKGRVLRVGVGLDIYGSERPNRVIAYREGDKGASLSQLDIEMREAAHEKRTAIAQAPA